MMNIIKILRTGVFATAAVGLMTSASLSAATIAQYTFASNLSATTEDANLTADTIAIGAGINVGGSVGRSSGAGPDAAAGSFYLRSSVTSGLNQISLANAVTADDYISFDLTVADGFEMDLSSFTFEHGYSRNGTFAGKQSRAYLLSDINGFASDQFIAFHDEFFDVNGGSINYGSAATISLAAAEYQGLTGTTEFRLYFADNTGGSDYIHRFDDLSFNGTVVSAVPEPGTYALMSGLLALCSVMLRRRRA